MLDLHNHTTYSDGMLTPQELVEKAINSGVRALGITDHDTLGGWQEAQKAAEETELEIVPGIELSTVYNGRSLHILGYYPDAEKLIPPLQERIAGRYRRATQMIEKLAELGYSIELPERLGEMAPGRPHIARALMEAGYVKSPQSAFDKWLGEGKPAYVQYEKFSAQDGIKLLRECSAVPVWAHPYLFRGGVVEEVLPELVEAGLMGIEVDHPCHSVKQRLKLGQLAREYGLLRTGGSDYHGGEEDSLNRLELSLDFLVPLKEAASGLSAL
jgi:predicted metal-dependent phosphoesterase TrpH